MKRRMFVILALAALILALACGAALADESGTCGSNLTWTFNSSTGELTISGRGDMTSYMGSSEAPWDGFRGNITTLTIEDGATGISGVAFCLCPNLTSVTIPKSVSRIGNSAFYSCPNLTSVTVPNPEAVFGKEVFDKCASSFVLRGWNPSTAKTYAEAEGFTPCKRCYK